MSNRMLIWHKINLFYNCGDVFFTTSGRDFSSRGFAPPNILECWVVAAIWFSGSFIVLGFNCNFGLPGSAKITFI